MELEDIQGKKYPGYGRCIYCGCRGEKYGLRGEHIIPFSLGGNAEIENASCKRCEGITSYLDDYLGRHIYNEYRSHAGVQSREPKKRPKSFPARIVVDENEEIRRLSVVDHPYFLAMPIWGNPAIVTRALPLDIFPIQKAHIFEYIPENLRETMQITEQQSLQVRASGTINHATFARAVAKIGYSHAIIRYGLDGFRKLVLPRLILGYYPCIPHFVGCELDDPPPPDPKERLHWVDFRTFQFGRLKLIVASIRLFAHSGVGKIGMPIYRVVVAAPKIT